MITGAGLKITIYAIPEQAIVVQGDSMKIYMHCYPPCVHTRNSVCT